MPIAFMAAALLAQGSAPAANPFVDPLFSDNMVLQRDMQDPIWGWTTPGAKVTVTIDGKMLAATADASGKWMTKLPKFPAGGSFTLAVSGPSVASFSNVTFGDVWICSGQSNMEMGVQNLANPAEEIAAANYPNIRLYRVPKRIAVEPVPFVNSNWQVCTPASLASDGDWGGFSAVGYFFGRKLHQDLKVPIGLIHTSWGGTIAEAWASAGHLDPSFPEFRATIQSLKELAADQRSPMEKMATWYAKNDSGTSGKWQDPAISDGDWKSVNMPSNYQNAGIPELVNPRSVVWVRRTVDLPTDGDFSNVTLRLQVDDNDATFVNGTFVGATDGVTAKRAYKVPVGVLHGGANTIAIRITDTNAPGGIVGGPVLEGIGTSPISLAGAWKIKLGTKITDANALPASVSDNPNQATVLYNGMVAPLVPFGVKGAIWYQGESNVGRAKQYQKLLPTMIKSWRDAFGQGDFPFLIVQLAGFQNPPKEPGEDGWADLREAQEIASKTSPRAGIATAIDIGDQFDIHPKNKQEVGRRLALVAEAKVYGQKLEYSGPTYKGLKVEGSSIRVSFDHANGLKTKDGQAPQAFAIAGTDQRWHWADAKIEGKSVVLSSAAVPNPIAVRYAWLAFFDLNLQNGEGLPAFPFRSDAPKTK